MLDSTTFLIPQPFGDRREMTVLSHEQSDPGADPYFSQFPNTKG